MSSSLVLKEKERREVAHRILSRFACSIECLIRHRLPVDYEQLWRAAGLRKGSEERGRRRRRACGAAFAPCSLAVNLQSLANYASKGLRQDPFDTLHKAYAFPRA